MKKLIFLLLAFIVFALGCETLPPPTPEQIITNPLGTTPLRRGMTKEEVIELWGYPNKILEKAQDEIGVSEQMWVYEAAMPGMPVDYNYLSKQKTLTFKGDNLVSW